jgi:phospholipid/cholesterol/gamma-HCH transport system substrate-binding protein
MTRLSEQDPRFRHLERKVGLFVIFAIATMAVAVTIMGLQQGIFTPKTQIYFLDDSGEDLNVGMAVKIRGFKIGKLREVKLNEQGKVEAILRIDSSYMKWIGSDSVARLVKEMFIGDSTIEITPGSPGKPPLEKDSMIAFVRDRELIAVARAAMEEVKPVLLDIKKIIQYVDDPEGDFKSSIANINRLSGDLMKTREEIERLAGTVGESVSGIVSDIEKIVQSLQEEIIPEFRSLAGRANSTMETTEKTVESVNSLVATDLEKIAGTLRNEVLPGLSALMKNADRAVVDGGRALEALGDEIPGILEKVDAGLDNLVRITEEMKKISAEAPGMVEKGDALIGESQDLVRSVREALPFGEHPMPTERRLEADSYERLE